MTTAPDTDSVRWLTADQQHAWRSYLEASQLLLAQLDKELRESRGLALGEYELLVRLSEQPNFSMRMARLAAEVAISRSRLTHIVSRMEARGLLGRSTTTGDGRGVLCTMTDAGYRLLVDAAPSHVASVRNHFIDRIDADGLDALGQAMDDVASRLRRVRCIERD